MKNCGRPYSSITTFPEPEPGDDLLRTALWPQYHTSIHIEVDNLNTMNWLSPLARRARIRRLPTQQCTWHVPAGNPRPVRDQMPREVHSVNVRAWAT